MSKRMEALYRLLLLIPLVLFTYVGSIIFGLIIVPWMILDIVWQLVVGSEGLSPDGYMGRILAWMYGNTRFVFLGGGEWNWLP